MWLGLFGALFLAIVFLQSGLDKLLNYKTELAWIQQKFSHSALHRYVGLLFFILAIAETISGVFSLSGAFQIFFASENSLALIGAWCSSVTMLMLIFGQRVTKDYTGAAALIPYFIATLLVLYSLAIFFYRTNPI
jgi:uncharacterized membrane protein YphA (DoxX/SURF4 family)